MTNFRGVFGSELLGVPLGVPLGVLLRGVLLPLGVLGARIPLPRGVVARRCSFFISSCSFALFNFRFCNSRIQILTDREKHLCSTVLSAICLGLMHCRPLTVLAPTHALTSPNTDSMIPHTISPLYYLLQCHSLYHPLLPLAVPLTMSPLYYLLKQLLELLL